MKKISLLSLVLGVLLLSALSFTSISARHIVKSHYVAKKKSKLANCTATITGVTLVSLTGSTATISITYSGNPDHFVYGGYYNPAPNDPIPQTNLYTTTLRLPLNGNCGARVHFQCVCSDGTIVGATHGLLFGCGQSTIYF